MASYQQMIQAQIALEQGGVIAYPTEAVFGYGCDPFNPQAVERLLAIKCRPWHKGLILIAANTDQIEPLLAPLTAKQRQQVESTWPGPVTWLLPDPDHWAPAWIRGQHSSVAVRVSAHPTARALCQDWGGPIVSTSANRSGEQPCFREMQFRQRLRKLPAWQRPDMVVGGETLGLSKPSEIRDLLTGEVIRS